MLPLLLISLFEKTKHTSNQGNEDSTLLKFVELLRFVQFCAKNAHSSMVAAIIFMVIVLFKCQKLTIHIAKVVDPKLSSKNNWGIGKNNGGVGLDWLAILGKWI